MMSTQRRVVGKPGTVILFAASIAVLAAIPGADTRPIVSADDIQRAAPAQPNQAAKQVSTEELRRILAERSATLFDARPVMEFAAGHIPGAVNVSAMPGQPTSLHISDAHKVGRLLNGDRNAPAILYCSGTFCGRSSRLAEDLLAVGYT
jgi:rhodanese-related sulfurtransferase